MSNGGIYYIPLTVGDVQSRTSSCEVREIGMFDLKKQLFYLVFLEPVWRNSTGRYRKVFRGRSNCWLSTLVGERKASADSKPLPGLPGTVLHTMAPLLVKC